MHRSKEFIGILLAIFAATYPSARVFAADAKAEVIARDHQCLAAKTLDEEMKCYDASNDLTLYDVNTPREFDGPAAVRANFKPTYDNVSNIKMQMSEERVMTDGNLALSTGIVHMTGTDKSGKAVDLSWRSTNVWRNENGTWKIVHAHYSFPVDVVTGRPDMQSKP
jgi:ketosteroid isomerase-like protein